MAKIIKNDDAATKADINRLESKMDAKFGKVDSDIGSLNSEVRLLKSNVSLLQTDVLDLKERMIDMEKKSEKRHDLVMGAIDRVLVEYKVFDTEKSVRADDHGMVLNHEEELEKLRKIHPNYTHDFA